MKTPLLIALLLGLLYYYHGSGTTLPVSGKTVAAQPTDPAVANQAIIIARAPSSYDRWQTGPNAQTDLKTGPNAQTDFLPFAPSEHATWNQTAGYTIVRSTGMRVH